MTILFPKTTCLVSEALDRIGRRRFGCKWTGKEIDARRLPELGKVKEAKRKVAEDSTVLEDLSGPLGRWVSKQEFLSWPDPDSEEYRAERDAYSRHAAACRDLRDALRYEHVPSYMVTENGQRINIPGHWLEQPMQLFIGAFLDPATRSRLGLGVDEVKVRDDSGLDGSGLSLRELIRPTRTPQDSGVRWKDSRDKGWRVKDPRIAGAKGVLYVDQVALDKGLQDKGEGTASGDALPPPGTAGAEGSQPKTHAETAKLRGELKTWIEESTRVKEAERPTKADFLQQAREEVNPQITKYLFNEVWRTAEIPTDLRKAGVRPKRLK